MNDLAFAVVDVETTGFSPRLHDRLIEIAIIRLNTAGEVQEEYVTLVNPMRDVGPTYIHGITASDVADAPTFEEIVGDVVDRLDQAVFVTHNARFDRGFISAELTTAGLMLPELPSLCTLSLAHRLYPEQANHRLATCCEASGLAYGRSHSALEDARAVALLLGVYLKAARERGWDTLAEVGCEPVLFPAGWPSLPKSGRHLARGAPRAKGDVPFLARVVASLGSVSARTERIASYMDLLDRVLEDRRVTEEEGRALEETAEEWGLSREEALASHLSYLEALVVSALADGEVSEHERRDLEAVTQLLALDVSTLDALLASRLASARDEPRSLTELTSSPLAGKTVCFTGALNGRLEGQPITREIAEELATLAGLEVVAGVTKGLEILVVADPNSQSGKAKKARAYGTRVMAEAAFWPAIGVQVE